MAQPRRPLSDRVYAWLLSLFPREFRGDFADGMIADFRDQRADAGGAAARARLWVSTTGGMLRQAPIEHLHQLWRDVSYAVRLLRRSPAFTAVAVLTLALGLGTNAAVFSLADVMLFRPLPFPDPDRLVLLQGLSTKDGRIYNAISPIDFEQIRGRRGAIEDLGFAVAGPVFTWIGQEGFEQMRAVEATANLLDVVGVSPLLGRPLRPGDDATMPRPAMVTFSAWQRRFGRDPAVVGRTVWFEQGPVQIVGVLPQGFVYPSQIAPQAAELLVVAPPAPGRAADPRTVILSPVGRLRRGVSIRQAQSEVDVIVRAAAQQYPETTQGRAGRVANLQYAMFELSRPTLWLLVGAALSVLLIACVNLATLLTARGAAREREMGIRMAIGASRSRIVRQVVAESLVLATLSGIVALAAGAGTFRFLSQFVPPPYRLSAEGLDTRALVVTCALSVLAGVLFSVLPALRLSRPDLGAAIRQQRQRRSAPGMLRTGAPLIACEVALATVLMSATALTVNSFARMRMVDLGIEPQAALLMSVRLPRALYASPASRGAYRQQLLASLRQTPGIEAAGAIDSLQVGGAAPPAGFKGVPAGGGVWRITPGYLHAVGTTFLDGRDFTDDEVRSTAPVAIVSDAIARHFWGNAPAIGRQLQVDRGDTVRVIGVVRNVRPGYGQNARPSVYRPMDEQYGGGSFVVRATGDRPAAITAMLSEAQRLEPKAIVSRPAPIATQLEAGVLKVQFETALFVLFGAQGLLVASIGVYGLMAFWVSGRTREMGVRIALGADARRLKALVARQSAVPLAIGLGFGLAGALALGRQLQSLLYEITAHDPVTLGAVVVILLGTGLGAAYLPARRAARVDPVIALRAE